MAAIVLGILADGARTAGAVTVTVPDEAKTIQQAIDSGADEVLVRPGVYPETLVIARAMDVKGLVPYGTTPDSLPVIAGLVFEDFRYIEFHTMYLRVWSLRILSQVRNQFETSPFWDPLEIEIAGCALDGGLRDADGAEGGQIEYYLRRCTIDGPVHLSHPQRVQFERSRIRAPIVLGPWPNERCCSSFDFVTVNDNTFTGPTAGIDVTGGVDSFDLIRNRFEGCLNPVRSARDVSAYANTFIGPGHVAIECTVAGELYPLSENSIVGFEKGVVARRTDLYSHDNRIEDCGVAIDVQGWSGWSARDTILSCGVGARLAFTDRLEMESAVVGGCREEGLQLQIGVGTITKSVVGRCGGDGIRVSVDYALDWSTPPVILVGNTSYANGGSGYVVSVAGTSIPADARNNIAYGNGRHGLEVANAYPVLRDCNDWFANAAGDVQGAPPVPGDLSLDPLFCDVTLGNVHLSALSPLLRAAGCGQIGALGQGCEAPIVSRLTTFTVGSRLEGIEVRWRVVDAAPGFAAWVERADAAAGPWGAVQCERTSDGDLTVEFDRSAEPSRTYWYRLVATDRGVTRALGDAVSVATAPPQGFALLGTGPNPSPGAFEAAFQLAHAADIALELFDPQGRRIAMLANGTWPAGIHHATWGGGRTAPAGVYLLRYQYPGGEARRRIVLMR